MHVAQHTFPRRQHGTHCTNRSRRGIPKGVDPLHPIIDKPEEYRLLEVRYRAAEVKEPYIDLLVARDQEYRTLRFMRPRVLQIERELPESPSGVEVRDVSAQNLKDMALWVSAADGAITFWARKVHEIDRSLRSGAGAYARLRTPLTTSSVGTAQALVFRDQLGSRRGRTVERRDTVQKGGGVARFFLISTNHKPL